MSTLYVLYNADASILGKLRYGYRKVTCPEDAEAVCAACDITHGGLSLKETPCWVEVKKEIAAAGGVKVVQWHRDEVSKEVNSYLETHKVAYPAALLEKSGEIQVVMDKAELGACKGDPKAFLDALRTKGIVSSKL